MITTDCSLVGKSWIYPTRRRIFHTTNVAGDRDLRSWVKNIPPTNGGLLYNIRTLACKIMTNLDSHSDLQGRDDFLRGYSASLHQLAFLSLDFGRVLSIGQIRAPSKFQHIFTVLALCNCCVAIHALVALVNYFPNLADLRLIDAYGFKADPPRFPPLS